MAGASTNPEKEALRRSKISKALKGRKRPMSDETKRRIALAHTGLTASEETRQRMSQSAMGRRHTAESKRRMSESQAARDHSYLQRGGHPQARRIRQLTPDGQLVKTWDCMRDITDDPRFGTILLIRQCCQGKRNLYKGYRWEYAETDETPNE